MDHLATGNSTLAPSPSSSPFQQENFAAMISSFDTLYTLVDPQFTPAATYIVDSSPSSIINDEVYETFVVDPLTITSKSCVFESPSRFILLGDVDEAVTEPSILSSLTRGGRETKPLPNTKTWNGRKFEEEESVAVVFITSYCFYCIVGLSSKFFCFFIGWDSVIHEKSFMKTLPNYKTYRLIM